MGIDYVQAQVNGRVSGGEDCRNYHEKCPHSIFEVSALVYAFFVLCFKSVYYGLLIPILVTMSLAEFLAE